jgi:signal transduction histidine kinase
LEHTPDFGEHGSERAFWIGFTIGWGAYFAISLSFGLFYEGLGAARSFVLALVNSVPPAATAAVVAFNRDRVLRPEWSALRMVGVQVVLGALFAAVNSVIFVALIEVTGLTMGELENAEPVQKGVALFVNSLFLYAVFFGLLLWSESRRRYREAQQMTAREAVLRAEAEAKAVRAQFNPHFVFNTLHSLMLLVRADPETAERAIEDVATLIRYASIVQRRDLDAVPLAKELEVARRYVELEQLRLGPRLRVEWDTALDPATVTIPAFALQTLVENAIKHGVEPVDGDVRIRVSLALDGTALSITVSDDGAGADPSTVEAAPGRGLGLLRRRLELRHPGHSDLTWETSPGHGFRVRVSLPALRPARVAELDLIETRVGRLPTGAEVPA